MSNIFAKEITQFHNLGKNLEKHIFLESEQLIS